MKDSVTRKLNVMVVDHSAVSCKLVTQAICETIDNDVAVTVCRRGEEALQKLQQQTFDLITTALLLPDMDGLDLCRAVRQTPSQRYVPLVVISGDANERLLREGFAAGVTDYFDKSDGYVAFRQFIREFAARNGELSGHILYVEDSRTAALVTMRIFERHGMKVTHVMSAEDAYEKLINVRDGKSDANFDIVVTDFVLEGQMTGGDLLHALRTRLHFSRQELPVLVITGNDSSETQVEIFHAGANDFVSKPLVEEILVARIRSLLLIKHQYTALKNQAHELHMLSITDKLTGLFNRRYLTENGQNICDDLRTKKYWVAMLDIDHFKKINDNHGHAVGDVVIADIGTLLSSFFASGTAFRYGGEEFALIYPEADLKTAMLCLEKFRKTVADMRPADLVVTVSIGLVNVQQFGEETLERLLNCADEALYAAKNAGRNRIYVANPNTKPLSLTQYLS